jgi:RNA recognition motif-containing protein
MRQLTLATEKSPEPVSPYVSNDNAIYIGNVPEETTESEIRTLFDTFGRVVAMNIMRKLREGNSK